jgi:hypothetical protein
MLAPGRLIRRLIPGIIISSIPRNFTSKMHRWTSTVPAGTVHRRPLRRAGNIFGTI